VDWENAGVFNGGSGLSIEELHATIKKKPVSETVTKRNIFCSFYGSCNFLMVVSEGISIVKSDFIVIILLLINIISLIKATEMKNQ
jgi:hypothetical protein